MLRPFLPIFIIFVVGVVIPVAALVLSAILGPKKATKRKLIPYESGMTPLGEAMQRMPVRFYVVAMLFILFDIEIIFLMPYALYFRQMGLFGLAEMGAFMGILLVGFIYIWRKGALRWD
ncbi:MULTISPECIES: NADH-quinone oxidoreductase subunit A [Herpetosiphon]|uniref:NADH-quinone oxidoreductase subunit A n=1 Tax=Herpetosiphon geysericola TaxID=70996 RepID=A0A0P6Y7Q6_9CHLR|nr:MULTISPECIES: NADH-quinone oxidoreductase subunit A [Herpetosiphon]KPL88845.1 NADH-quinone oxidoreductase [Herpetosiphon geysericola]